MRSVIGASRLSLIFPMLCVASLLLGTATWADDDDENKGLSPLQGLSDVLAQVASSYGNSLRESPMGTITVTTVVGAITVFGAFGMASLAAAGRQNKAYYACEDVYDYFCRTRPGEEIPRQSLITLKNKNGDEYAVGRSDDGYTYIKISYANVDGNTEPAIAVLRYRTHGMEADEVWDPKQNGWRKLNPYAPEFAHYLMRIRETTRVVRKELKRQGINAEPPYHPGR